MMTEGKRKKEKGNECQRVPYICGPLTELPRDQQEAVKQFYVDLANLWEQHKGCRPFVPHEHYDPVKNAGAYPDDVDEAERKQVCERTSVLIVCAIAPSWGGGIEVEMANRSSVPMIILVDWRHLVDRRLSRLLQGNGANACLVTYKNFAHALVKMQRFIKMIDILK